MAENVDVKNKFELVIMAGARAHQLLRGCTPKIDGPEKPARLAMLEVEQGQVKKME